MTKEDIIRMARECFADPDGSLVILTPELTAFAALVAAAQKEACAKVLDEMAAQDKHSNYYVVAARAIRAGGQS